MRKDKIDSPGTDFLRLKAEELLQKKYSDKATNRTDCGQFDADTLRLLHELEVHQIELEMQNEELRLAVNIAATATTLYDFAPAGYFTLSSDGSIGQLNLSGAALLGKDRSGLVNSNFRLFITQDTLLIFHDFLSKVFESNSKQVCEVRLIIKGNPSNYVHLEGIISEDGHNCLLTAVDITDRKNYEKEIIQSREKYELLNQHILRVREEERLHISREIHDELGQSLTALKIDLNWLHDNLDDQLKSQDKVAKMITITNVTLSQVQRISSELRPGMLDDLGLTSAIKWYCNEFVERTGIKCHLSLEEPDNEDPEINLVFYRVLQETLTNVARHSKAINVNIRFWHEAELLMLLIEDDGIGISPEIIASNRSLGLIGMQERARQYGGRVEISGNRNKGTKIAIVLPIKNFQKS